ncbi:MAG: hypothetical protein ACP5MI_10135 [Candidatus Kryptoniota bacterium]
MAVLGLLYLNGGKLNGRQIVPENWVSNSIVNHSTDSTGTWGDLQNEGYGYLWWLGKIENYTVFMALGWGGQYVLCIPYLNMIVVTTANPDVSWSEGDAHMSSVLTLIVDYILPAVKV